MLSRAVIMAMVQDFDMSPTLNCSMIRSSFCTSFQIDKSIASVGGLLGGLKIRWRSRSVVQFAGGGDRNRAGLDRWSGRVLLVIWPSSSLKSRILFMSV